jgi:hypothetical protein
MLLQFFFAKIHSDSAKNITSTSAKNAKTGTDPKADTALDHASANLGADFGAPAMSWQVSARPRAASLSHHVTNRSGQVAVIW